MKAVLLIVRGLAHALCALLLAASLGCAASAAAAAAQLRPQPVPAVLTNIRLMSENADEISVRDRLRSEGTDFAPMASQQPTQPSLGFALTNRGPRAVQPSNLKGLVRSLSFESVDTLLIMRFATVGRRHFPQCRPATGRSRSRSAPEERPSLPTQSPSRRPEAAARPTHRPRISRWCMLKYADVSRDRRPPDRRPDGQVERRLHPAASRQFGSNSLTGSSYNPGRR